jgi:PAS domain S-box-containing protein
MLILEEGRVVFSNEAACHIFGYTSEEIKPFSSFAELVHPYDRQQILETYRRHLAGESVKSNYQIGGLGKNTTSLALEIAVAPAVNVNGEMRTAVVFTDIGEQNNSGRYWKKC